MEESPLPSLGLSLRAEAPPFLSPEERFADSQSIAWLIRALFESDSLDSLGVRICADKVKTHGRLRQCLRHPCHPWRAKSPAPDQPRCGSGIRASCLVRRQ